MPNFLTKRRLRKCAAVALVVYIVGAVAWVPSVERHQFERFAVELDRTQTWRYGYGSSHHGAFFMKTRMTADAPRLKPIAAGDTLTPIMARELRLLPWKALFELGFYATLWALWGIGLARFRHRLSGPDSTRWRRSVAYGLSWAVLITAEMLSYLISGYGEPLLSNQEAPGALGAIRWGLPSTGTAWGYSFTYHWFLELSLLSAMVSLKSTLGFLPPMEIRTIYLLVTPIFYFTVATAGNWIIDWLRELGERSGQSGARFGKRGNSNRGQQGGATGQQNRNQIFC